MCKWRTYKWQPRYLFLLGVASVFLAGCASHYFKSLQQNRLYYATEQIQQSIDEIKKLNIYAVNNQRDMMIRLGRLENWPAQDMVDTQAGIEQRGADVEYYLFGLQRAKDQILATSKELEQQSEWIWYHD